MPRWFVPHLACSLTTRAEVPRERPVLTFPALMTASPLRTAPQRVAIVFGTRPEAIKIAPVYFELRRRGCEVILVNSGQHRELLDPILDLFGLTPQHELEVMVKGQSLHELSAGLMRTLGATLRDSRPQYVLVQGDTTTAFAGALAAFYEQIPVGHIEAGLRTNQRYSPFPEEINRRLVSVVTTDHFAPTARARQNLRREGIADDAILVTGNTVIDALRWVNETHESDMLRALETLGIPVSMPYILMTTHRRENLGEPMREALTAVRDFLAAHPDVGLVLPMHRNPVAREAVLGLLGGEDKVRLIEAQDYLSFIALMKHSLLLLTDSGGVQEEAPYFGKRTVVLRETTERPEAVEAGVAVLVGTSGPRIRVALDEALAEARRPGHVSRPSSPFGDGFAAGRVVDRILGADSDA